MGMELCAIDTDDRVRLSWEMWNTLFHIARNYGWDPAGTVLCEENWDGSYHRNDGALVTTDDAVAMGTALRTALANTRYVAEAAPASALNDCAPAPAMEVLLNVWRAIQGVPPEQATCERVLQYHRTTIREVITFLEKGAFRIY